MSTLYRRHLRLLTAALAMAGAAAAMAQGHLTVSGKLRVDGGNLDNSKMVVYKDGEKLRTITDLKKFELEMDLGADYILSFEKDGFVTKKLSFNTNVPTSEAATPFMPFTFIVSLFKQYDGVNTVVFNQPVGMIRYDDEQEEFDYDTDYTKSIQSALEEAQAAVEKKQKEESDDEADSAKRKAQAEKDRAKEDARAAKEAADKAKAEARARKEADEQAARDARLAQQAATPPPPPPPAPAPKPKEGPKPQPAPPKPKEVPEPRPQPPPPPRKTPPPPAPVVAPRPKPARKPLPPPPPARPAEMAKVNTGGDERLAETPRMAQEASPVERAKVRTSTEPRPKFESTPVVAVRHKDVLVETNQVVTVVRVELGAAANEYRKVVRKYSGTFYFKDGISCSQETYEHEALADMAQ